MKTTREMKAALLRMQALYEESDALFEADEAASDKAYAEAFKLNEELVEAITKATKGMIDSRTARAMICTKADQLLALCERHM